MQQVTHVECVYNRTDKQLVQELFSLLGFTVSTPRSSPYMLAHVQPGVRDAMSNVIYASESTPAQQAFESALREQLASSSPLRVAADGWRKAFHADPQRSVHFGFRYESKDEFEAAISRLRAASEPCGPLEHRLSVTAVYCPGDPGSITDTMAQGFVWTDLLASGLLLFGQHIEMQWHVESQVTMEGWGHEPRA